MLPGWISSSSSVSKTQHTRFVFLFSKKCCIFKSLIVLISLRVLNFSLLDILVNFAFKSRSFFLRKPDIMEACLTACFVLRAFHCQAGFLIHCKSGNGGHFYNNDKKDCCTFCRKPKDLARRQHLARSVGSSFSALPDITWGRVPELRF